MSSCGPGFSDMVNEAKRTSFSGFPNNYPSMFLDRTKPGIRGSTPDSEALVSSDDEPDQVPHFQSMTSNPIQKGGRRASWFNDGQQGVNQRLSITHAPFSPISPGSTTPSGEVGTWNTATNTPPATSVVRSASGNVSFPWGNTIWNNDVPKGPPQRLAEVLPSPTTVLPPGPATMSHDENHFSNTHVNRDQKIESSLPFSIPLQPTLKSYRSQSYSVGQLESDLSEPQHLSAKHLGHTPILSNLRRGNSYAPLHRRPSRPSIFGELSHDPSQLSQLQEVDDDDHESSRSSVQHHHHQEGRTLEDLAGENAALRQELAARDRSSLRQYGEQSPSQQRHLRASPFQVTNTELTKDNMDSPAFDTQVSATTHPSFLQSKSFGAQHAGKHVTGLYSHKTPHGDSDIKASDSTRKNQWQSSLGFSYIGEPSKSRRHSFAELPTRQNSISSHEDATAGTGSRVHGLPSHIEHQNGGGLSYMENLDLTNMERHKDGYLAQESRVPAPLPIRQDTDMSHLNIDDSTSPEDQRQQNRMMAQQNYARQLPHMLSTLRYQSLYIVTFKCLRADIFYIQEHTGLGVKKGDLVIVEADRGTDLGTVVTNAVLWPEAKHAKDEYTQKHHEWLMAFSHHTQNGTIAAPNPNGPPMTQSSALGLQSGSFQDAPSADFKPKMIKRLAQTHEVAILRDKEGAEAKAKRMCQQKVLDHHLAMEILDAEFQMDWKKLTFFYFADSYINFNPLVTDLFKLYKTRIWMSAINTAAIAAPTAGLRPPAVQPYSPHNQTRARPIEPALGRGDIPLYNTSFSAMQNASISNVNGFDQIYNPQVHSQAFDTRQMPLYDANFRLAHHQASIPPSLGLNEAYSVESLRQTQSSSARHQSTMTDRYGQFREWPHSFQGLSIDR